MCICIATFAIGCGQSDNCVAAPSATIYSHRVFSFWPALLAVDRSVHGGKINVKSKNLCTYIKDNFHVFHTCQHGKCLCDSTECILLFSEVYDYILVLLLTHAQEWYRSYTTHVIFVVYVYSFIVTAGDLNESRTFFLCCCVFSTKFSLCKMCAYALGRLHVFTTIVLHSVLQVLPHIGYLDYLANHQEQLVEFRFPLFVIFLSIRRVNR